MSNLTKYAGKRTFDGLDTALAVMNEFDRLSNDIWKVNKRTMYQGVSPSLDIIEYPDYIMLEMEIPGIKTENVTIHTENNTIVIKGSKTREINSEDAKTVRSERYYGEFLRTFTLPETLRQDNISAEYEAGVLKIKLLKKEEVKPKQVEINQIGK